MPVKLVLFAHTPPPLHGQSYMVEQLLAYLQRVAHHSSNRLNSSSAEVVCYHVNAQFSATLADIGQFRPKKLWRLLRYVWQAWAFRWRKGAEVLLYVPAPGKRSALLRDWLIMALCRPLFARRVFWWQAAGLGEWLEMQASPLDRWLTRRLLGSPDLSIVLGEWGRRDAEALGSRRIVVVPNTVPDPCPLGVVEVLRNRDVRAQARARLCGQLAPPNPTKVAAANRFRLLFLSLCTREKGLFDALEATALVNQRLAGKGSPLRVELAVAGEFHDADERAEFDQCCRGPEWQDAAGQPLMHYCGFVEGDAKAALLRESDCLCFPTYYAAEGFPLVLVEAMAWGLHIVTTRWRIIPELFPDGFDGLVEPRQPAQIADAIEQRLFRPAGAGLRQRYEQLYAAEPCLRKIRQALLELESTSR